MVVCLVVPLHDDEKLCREAMNKARVRKIGEETKKRRYVGTDDEVGGVLVEDVEVLCD